METASPLPNECKNIIIIIIIINNNKYFNLIHCFYFSLIIIYLNYIIGIKSFFRNFYLI